MTRSVNPPSLSTVTVSRFFGQVSDRPGGELNKGEFTTLKNVRTIGLRALKPRYGGEKVFTQTESAGSKVYGLHTFLDDSGSASYYKLSNGTLKKSTTGAWSAVGAVTTFAAATTWFATMNTRDTGASASTTGTTTGATTTSVTVSGAGWTINAYVGSVLVVNNETKRIVGNTADTIYVAERFDATPSSASISVYPRSQEFFFANGTEFYKCDATTLTAIQTSNFAYAFEGIVEHSQRLFAWKGTRLHWSDAGVGEHFSRNAWRDFQTPIQRVIDFGQVLLVFERTRVTAVFGDNPDNFQFVGVLNNVGTTAPKSPAVYGDYMFFLSEEHGVCVISLASLANNNQTNEPLSVSQDIINSDLLAQSSANLQASAGGIHEGIYHLCVDDDWYVLDVKNSFDAPRDENGNVRWIFTKDDRPDAMDANIIGKFGTRFVVGAQDNGQVYEIEKDSVFADDSTAIDWIIDKQDWIMGEYGTINKYKALRVRQAAAGSSYSVSYFFVGGGSSYGSAVTSINLNTATETPDHRVIVPSNPSDSPRKSSGEAFSYKITGSGSIDVPEIQQINMLFYPGTLQ